MKDLVLEINNLKKSYGKTEILKGLNLKIYKGDRIVLLGSNGSGKTTLINIITGLINKTDGKIIYFGDPEKTELDFNKKLGIQFQDGAYPIGYKVNEIIKLIYDKNYNKNKNSSRKDWEHNIRNPIIKKITTFLNLNDKLNKKVSKLSGGEKQKLSILIALISKPEILIFDEISTGLDIESQENILNSIYEYVERNNITLILVSHLLNEINKLGDKIALIDDGVISELTTKKEIIKKYKSLDVYTKTRFLDEKGTNKILW